MTFRQFLYGLLGLALIYAISGTTGDPDLWGHVRFGQDMLQQGAIRLPDIYSFTTDRAWVNHEWLAEILFAVAFNCAGSTGLNLLRVAVSAGILALIAHAGSGFGSRRTYWIAAAALGIYMRAHPIRPQMFSLLIFTLLLVLLARVERDKTLRPLLWIPILMSAWVNLHGGWVVGIGVFGFWSALSALGRPWRERRILAAAFAAALLATLINPYGSGMWQFLATTVRVDRPMIADWQPLYTLPFTIWVSWLTGLVVLIVALARARTRDDWMRIAIPAALGAAAIRVSRLDAFFAVSSVVAAIGVLSHHERAPARQPSRPAARSLVLAGAFALCVAAVGAALVPRVKTVAVPDHVMPDLNVATYLQAQKLQGKVLMWFDWGQYAIWHFGPELKVSIDGRRETVYGPELVAAHLQFYFGNPDSRYADSLKADLVLIPRHLPVVRALHSNGWVTLCEGPSSILLARHASGAPCPSPKLAKSRLFPQL